jgi:hypothetical protein
MTPLVWKPDEKVLREFSEAWLIAFGMILSPMALARGQAVVAGVFWCVALAGRLIGYLRPMWLRPVFVGMSLLTWPIGWVVSNALLAVVYYGVATPIGLIRRFRGHDPLRLKSPTNERTVWEPIDSKAKLSDYLRQF